MSTEYVQKTFSHALYSTSSAALQQFCSLLLPRSIETGPAGRGAMLAEVELERAAVEEERRRRLASAWAAERKRREG